jgi:hypothetical protein
MVSKFRLFKLVHSDLALVVVMLVLFATVAFPVVVPMAMMIPVVMLMMPTIMVPMSILALDTMHYAAGGFPRLDPPAPGPMRRSPVQVRRQRQIR